MHNFVFFLNTVFTLYIFFYLHSSIYIYIFIFLPNFRFRIFFHFFIVSLELLEVEEKENVSFDT